MAPKSEPTLVEKISEALALRIVHGLLKPGIRLRQDEVASEFGASHVPVREAFRLLEAQGLVQSEPRRGVSGLATRTSTPSRGASRCDYA